MKPDVREAPISIRAKKSQRDLIDMAASLVSKSLTDFMLEVACREAQNILLDGVSLDIENYCTIRTSPACQSRYLWFLSALQ